MPWNCCYMAYTCRRYLHIQSCNAVLTSLLLHKSCLHDSKLMQILFSKDNVEDVLRISDRLQVIPVKDACTSWLEKELDAFNVLETLLL